VTRELDEKFGSQLTRVLKKVNRKDGDGGTKTVDQAFHVRKAAPGDRYAAFKTLESRTAEGPGAAGAEMSNPEEQPADQADGSQDPTQQPDESQEPVQPAPVVRIMVRRLDIPWLKKGDKAREKAKALARDPISPELRQRFKKGSGSIAMSNPAVTGLPITTVVPTDRIFWGADEPGLLVSLRSGTIRKMRLVGGSNGLMIIKIEAIGGGSFYGYMWMESLRCSLLKQIWGDIIDFSDPDGPLSKRAACSYETAKACGLDDLTPPTVHRVDDDGDIRSMLPDSLIEQANEWVSTTSGIDPDAVKSGISGHATVQLVRGEPWPIESEEWFRDLFGSGDPSALNDIWSSMPPDRRIGLLRLAALDFVTGSLDRSFGDLVFSDDPRHPVVAYGGEMSIPCPRTIGMAYASGGYAGYLDNESANLPLFWSEASTMLAVRGGDREIDDYELIGIAIASRMKENRAVELARSLHDHKLTALQISGILSRIWMMNTHSRDIAKDPYLAARYYASIVSGQADPLMDGVKDFVNNTMRQVLVGKFDFYKVMKSGAEDAA
jgi:hypothetical protein